MVPQKQTSSGLRSTDDKTKTIQKILHLFSKIYCLQILFWNSLVLLMAMLTEEICQRNSNHSPYISKLYIWKIYIFTSTFGQTCSYCPSSSEQSTGVHIRRMYCLNWCHSEKTNGILRRLMMLTNLGMIFDFDGNDNDNNDDYHDVDGFDNVHLGRTPWNSWWLGRLNWSRHLPLILATVLYQASHMCKDIWHLIKNHNPSSLLFQTQFQPEWHLSFLHKSYSPLQSLAQCSWHLFF